MALVSLQGSETHKLIFVALDINGTFAKADSLLDYLLVSSFLDHSAQVDDEIVWSIQDPLFDTNFG